MRRYFPTRTPIGERILVEKILPTRRGLGPQLAWEIVGVVADEKGRGLESPTDVGAYASFAQSPVVGLGLVARGAGDAGALIKSIQRAVWRVNKDQVLDRPMTVAQLKATVDGRPPPADAAAGRIRAAGDAAGVRGDLRRAVVRHREADAGAGHPRGAGRVALGSRSAW